MAMLILTVIGEDRPGLVEALSGTITKHGGNWEQSRMAHLASKFAGILLVSVAQEHVHALQDALYAMREDGLQVSVSIEQGAHGVADDHRRLTLELLGQDHPGIVHDISRALSAHGISIEELHTQAQSASMSGGTLFQAKATLIAPRSMALDDLRTAVEALANELMVDIELAEDSP